MQSLDEEDHRTFSNNFPDLLLLEEERQVHRLKFHWITSTVLSLHQNPLSTRSIHKAFFWEPLRTIFFFFSANNLA